MKKDTIKIYDLGITDYLDCLKLQKKIVESSPNFGIILITEHFPVITLGVREDKNKFAVDRNILEASGVGVVETRRGGGATIHNPGQLVVYPVLALRSIKLDVTEYIRFLEQFGINILSYFGLAATRKIGLPGLWVENKKIASLGVKISAGISYHGIAINISNDLHLFDSIVPCGLEEVRMCSLESITKQTFDMKIIKQRAATELSSLLNIECEYEQKTISRLA